MESRAILQDEKGNLCHEKCVDVEELGAFENASRAPEEDEVCAICGDLLPTAGDPLSLDDPDEEQTESGDDE